MKPGVPWSVKGIEPQARDTAKDAAHKAGLTLGQWLNQAILEQGQDRKKPKAAASSSGKAPARKSASRKSTEKPAIRKPAARTAKSGSASIEARFEELSAKLDKLVTPLAEAPQAKPEIVLSQPAPAPALPADELIGHLMRAEHKTDTAINAIRQDMSRIVKHIGRRSQAEPLPQAEPRPQPEPRPQSRGAGLPALEKTLSGMVEHIELTDRHNADVLRTIQSRLSELSGRLEEKGSTGDQEAIYAIEHRLGDIIDRLENQEQAQSGEAYQALESQISVLNAHMREIQGQDHSSPAITNLESRFNTFADRLSLAEQNLPDPLEFEALKSTLSELQAELTKMPAAVFPSAVQVLETRLGTLAGEVDTLRVTSVSPTRFNEFASRLDDVQGRLRATEKNLSGMSEGSSVHTRLEDLQRRVKRTEQGLHGTPDIKTVETRFKEIQQRIFASEKTLAKCADTETLERRLTELSQRLEQSISGGRIDPQVEKIESRVDDIVRRLDHGESGIDSSVFTGLETQINRIGLRLDQAEERFDTPLQSIQANLSQLYEGLESSRNTTIQAAEQAAVAAAQKIIASQSGTATGAEAESAISALEVSLGEIKTAADQADRQTQETLEAVHDTLERVVGRLTILEGEERKTARAQEEKEQAVVEGSKANLDTEKYADFRLPPLPDIPPLADDQSEPEPDSGLKISGEKEAGKAIEEPNPPTQTSPDVPAVEEAAGEPSFARAYDANADDSGESGFSRNGDFIAAARRAAQAANRAENGENGEILSEKSQPALIPIGKSKKRTLLYAVAALFLAVGALSVSGVLTPGNNSSTKAPVNTGSISEPANGDRSENSASLSGRTPKAFSYVPDLTGFQKTPGLQLLTGGDGLVVEMVTPAQLTPQFAPTRPDPKNAGQFAATTPGAGLNRPVSEITLAPSKSAAPSQISMASLAAGSKKTATRPVASPDQALELPPESIGSEALRKAAAGGNAQAQFLVGAAYADGRTGAADNGRAAVWYQRAAAQGHPPAQYRLGTFFEKGRGVEKDINSARTWYERAAQSGNRKAMHNLAVLLAGTSLGQPDFARAARWFLKAAEMGLADSQFNLGILHERGLGVQNDPAKAYKWFRIAAAAGDKDARARSVKLEGNLPAGLLARTRAEVAAWRPKSPDPAANATNISAARWAGNGTAPAASNGAATVASGETKTSVTQVQRLLVELGYDPGPADGLVGPQTRQAIRTFERERGLPETGRANLGVVKALEDAAG